MRRADRIILAISLLVLTRTLSGSSETPSSCPFSNSYDVDQGHHHHHDHSHDVHHSHMETPAPHHDHGHAHDHDHDNHHDHDSHGHGCRHHHDHTLGHLHSHKLAEELAEEEELRLYGFVSERHSQEGHYHHEHVLPSVGLWVRALGCSLLVSMASLICLIILPLIVAQGKPSRLVVDFLAAFGAGAMLGDAFLHQLPHALGSSSGHSHGHEHAHHGQDHAHIDGMGHGDVGGHGHAHSIQDLSVGLAVLAGIILFFVVEKIVRQVEKSSVKKAFPWAHHHQHHHHQELDDDPKHHQHDDCGKEGQKEEDASEDDSNGSKEKTEKPYRRKVKEMAGIQEQMETTPLVPDKGESVEKSTKEEIASPNLVLGYLNLFSDGVHNFTDGMALGAAFLNHGTLGGWSRTLFLLAHELPQEVGDFGILVQSGFSVVKALAFNFLSALVALAGTAMALILGGNAQHSSIIEGFTAGGFIYIAVAGVLPEMHQNGTSVRATLLQLVALSLGMSIALYISLVE